MNLERVKVLNDYLSTLAVLDERKVSVFREIHKTNQLIQQEISSATDDGGPIADLGYHIRHNDVVTWDAENKTVRVANRLDTAADVIQAVRRYGDIKTAAEALVMDEVTVSNVLCFAARLVADDRYD